MWGTVPQISQWLELVDSIVLRRSFGVCQDLYRAHYFLFPGQCSHDMHLNAPDPSLLPSHCVLDRWHGSCRHWILKDLISIEGDTANSMNRAHWKSSIGVFVRESHARTVLQCSRVGMIMLSSSSRNSMTIRCTYLAIVSLDRPVMLLNLRIQVEVWDTRPQKPIWGGKPL